MKRILISQNEMNDGKDYVVVDGELINDEDLRLKYFRKLRETDDWNQSFKDDTFELKSKKNNFFLKSHYIDKDNTNRNIYYMYFVENNDNLDAVLDFLEKDSKIISRNIDSEKTLEIINKIKSNEKLKSIFYKLIIALVIASITYAIFKN